MREFDFITKLLKPLAADGLGDDCVFFDGYCVTKDMLIAGVHFFAGDAPYDLARKALRVNLSDLASSGAEPFGFMLGLALPKGTSDVWLGEFAQGLKADIAQYKLRLLGGDTVYHEGALGISVTAIGKCETPITRGGAKVGDNIYVSGKIGGGYLGLQAKLAGSGDVSRYELPEPRVGLVPVLREVATSCIDISDGLLADLGHICEESGLGAELNSAAIPLWDSGAALMPQLTGGDDYELLFTSAAADIAGCYKIGYIVAGSGIRMDGGLVEPAGFEHKT